MVLLILYLKLSFSSIDNKYFGTFDLEWIFIKDVPLILFKDITQHVQDMETIKNNQDILEEYDILANFPFSSETKRMGIILRNKKHGHIIFYLKGAENVIEKFVKKSGVI